MPKKQKKAASLSAAATGETSPAESGLDLNVGSGLDANPDSLATTTCTGDIEATDIDTGPQRQHVESCGKGEGLDASCQPDHGTADVHRAAAEALAERKIAEARVRRLRRQHELLKMEAELADAEDAAEIAALRESAVQGHSAIDIRTAIKREEKVSHVQPPFTPTTSTTNGGDQTYARPAPRCTPVPNDVPRIQDTMAQFSLSLDALASKVTLPPMEVTKFGGDPARFFKFQHQFNEMVMAHPLTDAQRMSRLLQFLDGRAKASVAGLEGVPGAFSKALAVIKQRFGQPYMIVAACIKELTAGNPVGRADTTALQDFADKSRMMYETLLAMDALHEVNTTNLQVMASRMSTGDQIKWRDQAQRLRQSGEEPGFRRLVEFLENRASAINDPVFGQIGQPSRPGAASEKAPDPQRRTRALATNMSQRNHDGKVCAACSAPHDLQDCTAFRNMAQRERKILVMKKRLCLRCLRPNHFAAQCKATTTCNTPSCNRHHHTLLHEDEQAASAPQGDTRQDSVHSAEANSRSFAARQGARDNREPSTGRQNSTGGVALQVVPVKVISSDGNFKTTLGLLDSGSELTFITSSLARELKLKGASKESVILHTVTGPSAVDLVEADVRLSTADEIDDTRFFRVRHARIIPKLDIDQANPTSTDLQRWEHLKDIDLPANCNGTVEVLIGADAPGAHVCSEYRVGRPGEPCAVHTCFGWTLMGPTGAPSGGRHVRSNLVMTKTSTDQLSRQMEAFMDMDRIGTVVDTCKQLSISERSTLTKMESESTLVDGHYEVPMLWRSEDPDLPNNKALAEARLRGLKRRLASDEALRIRYTEFVEGLLDEGYAEQVGDDVKSTPGRTWYLPHHPVWHPQKGKLRVVFDAAAEHEGKSLNQELAKGPDLTNNLVGVLLRFRQERVAISADVKAMFHQVKVPVRDADALRFLFWPKGDLNATPLVYRMTRHIFGAADSPSCATFALHKTARDNKTDFSVEAVETILNDFYVDDMLKSVDDTERAIVLADEVTRVLSRGGFRLTKWISNDRDVLESIPQEERARTSVNLDLDALPLERTLGVLWNVDDDMLEFRVGPDNRPMTKRGVLSTLSAIYDPLGLVCPVTLHAKFLMQRLWQQKLGWDEPLPETECVAWQRWKQELPSLQSVAQPRCYHPFQGSHNAEVSLHIFADASEDGYGACAYLRFSCDDDVHVALVAAKARTAPVRPLSIPRLELQAAVLGVRLSRFLMSELTVSISQTTFWTDSQTVLQFISSTDKRFHTFVAHRVEEIRASTSAAQWRHCPGKDNPADDVSRSLSATTIAENRRWWNGPEFLVQSPDCWPPSTVGEMANDNKEVKNPKPSKRVAHASLEVDLIQTLFLRASSWWNLQRLVAWLCCFSNWIAAGRPKLAQRRLTTDDLKHATLKIVHAVQATAFAEDLEQLSTGKPVSTSSRIANLKPFLEENLIRVGGRLQWSSSLSFGERHPLILPKDHAVSKLIIQQVHLKLLHAGQEQTLAASRREFWIVGGRALAKSVVRACLICQRANARPCSQEMAPLPAYRLLAYKPPFTVTGLDYFGPLLVKRARSTPKVWVCLFTCLNSRAVHLELAPSLSTDDFLVVLRIFFNRRGTPEELHSDNGTNFTGGERELREALDDWNQTHIDNELRQKGIRWIFQTPAAPHMSGVWERLVRSAKKHLKAVLGNTIVTEFELRGLLTEVENVLNNRPLTPVSDDPSDLEALTPNHFLLGRKVVGLPPGLFQREDCLRRKAWRKVQFIADFFLEEVAARIPFIAAGSPTESSPDEECASR